MQHRPDPRKHPRQEGRFDLSNVDLRLLSAEEWFALRAQIFRDARRERNRAIGTAIGRASSLLWRGLRQLLRWGALRTAWISHIRKRREQIAAAQLRGLSDQNLADLGLTRGEIDERVRYRPRVPTR